MDDNDDDEDGDDDDFDEDGDCDDGWLWPCALMPFSWAVSSISLLLILHPVHHANCISEFDSFIILLLIIIHVLSIGNKVYISSLHFNNPLIQIQINISPCLSNSWNPWCPIPKLFQQCLFVTIITMMRKNITKLERFFICLIQQW